MEAELETFVGWWRKHRVHRYILSVKVEGERVSTEPQRAGVDIWMRFNIPGTALWSSHVEMVFN